MLDNLPDLPSTMNLGVIPILVNTGAAALPAMMAAVISALAILFKPRELWRVCRRRPYIPLLVVVIGVGAYFGITAMMGGEPAEGAATPRRAATGNVAQAGGTSDWSRVALEIIRAEARRPTVTERPETDPDTAPAEIEEPVMFRHNLQRTGHAGGPSPLGLQMAWEYHADDFASNLSSPAVMGNRVFATATIIDPTATFGIVYALDAETGEELWLNDMVDEAADREMKGFFSSPSVTADGRYVIIGQGLHDDADCELLCIDTETGEIVWAVKTPIHIESSPAIEGDIVVAGAGAIEVGPERKPVGDPEGRGHPGYLFAVRISTGEELWRFQINDPEGSPAIRDGIVYAGAGVNGNEVVALRIDDDETLADAGKARVVWRTPTPYPAIGAITLTDDLVLIGCGNSDYVFTAPDPAGLILALDAETGEEVWRVELDDSVLGPIAVQKNVAVAPVRTALVDNRRRGQVVAIDLAENGRELWRYTFPRGGMALAGPAFTGTHVYAVSNDGYMVVLDAANGEMIEEHYINDPARPGELGLTISSPVVFDGRVVVGSETGGLRLFEGSEYK